MSLEKSLTFSTERLYLRPWQIEDSERLYELAKDPRIGPIAGWPVHKNVEESRSIIRDVLSAELVFAITEKTTGLVLGTVGLDLESSLLEKTDEAELGYWMGVPYWGRGYVPEAAEALLDYAFTIRAMERIWCACDERNQNSIRVQEKLSFVYQYRIEKHNRSLTGEIIDKRVSLLTKKQWKLREGA